MLTQHMRKVSEQIRLGIFLEKNNFIRKELPWNQTGATLEKHWS